MKQFKLIALSVFSVLPILLGNCGQAPQPSSRITLQFPGEQIQQRIHASVSNQSIVGSSGFALSDPADMSEITCYGVFVGGPEVELSGSSCKAATGAEIARFGIVAGLFPKNASVDLYVPSGRSRRIYVFGMKSSGACEIGVGKNLDESRYSTPFLLGQAVADLRPGDNSIPLEVSIDPAMKLDDCSFMPAPGTGALTLSQNAKTLGIGATYNFSASGGKPPYAFSVVSGSGSIDATGLFTAPGTAGFSTVRVTDSAGAIATGTVHTVEPGTTALDFGASGFATANVTSDDRIKDLAIQPDGKIVAVGNFFYSGFRDWGVARFNVDGTLDTSFSGDGLWTHSISSTQDEYLNSVALQPDGKIVVAGQCAWNISRACLARLNYDGTLDTSFGSSGLIDDDVTGSGFNSRARKVFVDKQSGKITVLCNMDATGNADWNMCALRYTSSGARDSSFASGGLSIIDLGGTELLNSGRIDATGAIYAVGYRTSGSDTQAAVIKLTPSGTLDTAFDSDGYWLGNIVTGGQKAHDIGLQSTGKLIVAIHDMSAGSGKIKTARLNSAGGVDSSFGSSGYMAMDFDPSFNDVPTSLHVQPDDRILVAGAGKTAAMEAFVFRLSSSGSLDTSFNNPNGMIFSANVEVNGIGDMHLDMVVGPSGAIFIGGTKTNTDQDFRIWKLLSDSN